jgi:hypothetical protein
MSVVTQLSQSASAQVRSRIRTLAGSLPHPEEEWTYAETELTWADFQWMSSSNQLRSVESESRSGKYRTPQRLAEAVRHYADEFDSVSYSGDDPLPRLSH